MPIYDSSLPVLLQVQRDGASTTLVLLSEVAGSAPTLVAADGVRANAVDVAQVVVSSGSPGITLDSVTTTAYADAPAVTRWIENDGTFTGYLPAPLSEGTEWAWDLTVVATVVSTGQRVTMLDPKMIVRKTHP